jgi:hypothetical protein
MAPRSHIPALSSGGRRNSGLEQGDTEDVSRDEFFIVQSGAAG